MIRITVPSYPNTPGSRFDLDYYVKKHCPMVLERLGESCSGCGAVLRSVLHGLGDIAG